MARITPLSGFPEWLPAQRVVERAVIESLRRTFELHGYCEIETRSVEPLDQLLRKGETDKEIYVLHRLQAAPSSRIDPLVADAPSRQLGLHFDLTIPFARWVLENAGRLYFPFKRYQIQKVWRGERPQEGRFREFYQADIDVVGADELPFHYEIELPLAMAEALGALREFGVPAVQVHVNNRKVVEGFYRGIGLDNIAAVLRCMDKLDKVGPETVASELAREAGANAEQARACLALAAIRGDHTEVLAQVRALAETELAVEYTSARALLETGLAELDALLAGAQRRAPQVLVADLKIARGLDYYTGSVYETFLVGHEDLGSICSGGRYDNLASDGKRRYPGVGLSIGVSRLVSRLVAADLVRASRPVPTAVLVAVAAEDQRDHCEAVAAALRQRGIPTDVSPNAAKFGKQIQFADRRGIPYVWFPGPASDPGCGSADQVKDVRTGEQAPADPDTWHLPEADRYPQAVPVWVG